MNRPALVLFDDAARRDWRPFTLTRPAGELIFGTLTLRRRAERALGLDCLGHVTADHLSGFDEPGAPPVVDPTDVARDRDVVWLRAGFVAEPGPLPDAPALLVQGDRVVGLRPGPGRAPDPDFLLDPDSHAPDLPRHDLDGAMVDRVWDLMGANADRIRSDLAGHAAEGGVGSPGGPDLPAGVHRVGAGAISLGQDVQIAPAVVLDTRDGPIRLDDGVRVHPFTHVVGPVWVGTGSTLLGGPIAGSSIGPRCKVHGEIEETVVLGYSNKAHDGFLGHAYIGAWVNLGALTTNSDLKNNYGPVRVWTPAGDTDTGRSKVGCFLGDHVKTAIGTMLNTGTVIEAGSNIFGGMPPKHVPPFSWGEPDAVYDFDRFIATAEVVMARRDIELTDRARTMLAAAWRLARG